LILRKTSTITTNDKTVLMQPNTFKFKREESWCGFLVEHVISVPLFRRQGQQGDPDVVMQPCNVLNEFRGHANPGRKLNKRFTRSQSAVTSQSLQQMLTHLLHIHAHDQMSTECLRANKRSGGDVRITTYVSQTKFRRAQ
jgi:hypothetical protein